MPGNPKQLTDALSLPVGDLIAEVGKGVAEAQQALDAQVIENFERIYAGDEDSLKQLRELGYRPTWYHIPEAEAELQVSLSISGNYAGSGKNKMFAMPVDATYKNNYEYNLEGSSKLKFRIVPIPEPSNLDSRAVLPNVVGYTLEATRQLLDNLNISYAPVSDQIAADAIVDATEPNAGTILQDAEIVTLLFE